MKNCHPVQEIRAYEIIIAEYEHKADVAKNENRQKVADKNDSIAANYSHRLDMLKSDHQTFKGYQAVFESGMQFIHQVMATFGKYNSVNEIDAWIWVTQTFSFLSMCFTFTSLILGL